MSQYSTWSFDDDDHFNNLCTNTLKRESSVEGSDNCKVCVTPLSLPPVFGCRGCTPVQRPDGWAPTMRVIFPEGLVDSNPSGYDEEIHEASKLLYPPSEFTPANYSLMEMLTSPKLYTYIRRLSVRWKPCPTQKEFVVKNRYAFHPEINSSGSCVWSWTSATWFGKKFHGDTVKLAQGGTVRLRRNIPGSQIENICHPKIEVVKPAEEQTLDYNFQEGNVAIATYMNKGNRSYYRNPSNEASLMFYYVKEAAQINDIFKKWPPMTGDDRRRFPVEGTVYSKAYGDQMDVTVPSSDLNTYVHRNTQWNALGNLGGYRLDVIIDKRIYVIMWAIESWYDHYIRTNANGCNSRGNDGYANGVGWNNHPDSLFCGVSGTERYSIQRHTNWWLNVAGRHNGFGAYEPEFGVGLMWGINSPWGNGGRDFTPRPANFDPPFLTDYFPDHFAYPSLSADNGGSLSLHSYSRKPTAWNSPPPPAPGQPGYTGEYYSKRPWNHAFVYGKGMRSTTYIPPNWDYSTEGSPPFTTRNQLCVWSSDIITCGTRGVVKCYKMADYRTNGSPKNTTDYPVNYEPIAGPTQFPSIIYVDVG